MRELLLGAGNKREKKLYDPALGPAFANVTTVDLDPRCEPDLLWDLNHRPLPYPADWFDEIHAYEVLEHIGRQGDWRSFFEEFTEYHRLLKPGGVLILSCPRWDSPWAWGDPGHTRVLSEHTFSFLDQAHIAREVGTTAMTDYREWWRGDFLLIHMSDLSEHTRLYALRKADGRADQKTA